jgi:hypothetical protein
MDSEDGSEGSASQQRELLKTQFGNLQITLSLLNEQVGAIADQLRVRKEEKGALSARPKAKLP